MTGTGTTLDALLPQRARAARIRWHGGHDVMAGKATQPALYAAIHQLFTEPPVPVASGCATTSTRTGQGHGRLERRTRERRAALNDYLDWPGAGQVPRRTYRAVDLTTGAVHEEVTSGLTSLPPRAATVAEVAALWRGHWTIENGVHYPRDVSLGEDAGQGRVGNAPQASAALRNGVRNLLPGQGWAATPDARRHDGAYAPRALRLLGALPAQL